MYTSRLNRATPLGLGPCSVPILAQFSLTGSFLTQLSRAEPITGPIIPGRDKLGPVTSAPDHFQSSYHWRTHFWPIIIDGPGFKPMDLKPARMLTIGTESIDSPNNSNFQASLSESQDSNLQIEAGATSQQ